MIISPTDLTKISTECVLYTYPHNDDNDGDEVSNSDGSDANKLGGNI